eukprot:scaffold65312_cov33-Tisochrysis_lutea.AAC.4
MEDQELRQVCAQISPTSVPKMDVPHCMRAKGIEPYTFPRLWQMPCILSLRLLAVSGSKLSAVDAYRAASAASYTQPAFAPLCPMGARGPSCAGPATIAPGSAPEVVRGAALAISVPEAAAETLGGSLFVTIAPPSGVIGAAPPTGTLGGG